MTKVKYLIVLLFMLNFLEGFTQEITIHPTPKIDSVWYSDVTEDSEPESMSCEENSIGYYRLKYKSQIVIDDFKKDTIKTKKEDWEEADEEAFDEEYNKDKKEELEALEKEFIEEDEDISDLTKEEIDRFIDVNWNGYGYNICKPDCESSVQQCYIYHEITQLKDYKKTYKYRTSYSWLEINDDGDNEVEIDFDLVIEYEAIIYFFVVCSCNDIPDLISAKPSKQLSDSNPWSNIDLMGEHAKPFYSFASPSKSFPTVPVLGGIAGGGALIYILTKDGEANPCPEITVSSIQNTTCGDASGSAAINLNPPGEYTYVWSSGQNTPSINNVVAGTYTVTVTQPDTDCFITSSVTIEDEIEEFGNIEVITTNADCGVENGSATINNPLSDVTYSWSNGEFGNMASGLASGEYSVSLTKGSCLQVVGFSILEKEPSFTVMGDIVQPSCGTADGSISIAVSPSGNYSFQWSNGESSSSISSIDQGVYEVTITENDTKCKITKQFNLEDLPPDFMLSFNSMDATCGVQDGSISVNVDPPGNYSFLWSNGETLQSLTDQSGGEYMVTVTLIDTDCSVTGNSKINEIPLDLEIEYTLIHPNCGLSDGTIDIGITPSGNYSFDWSNGQTTQNLSSLPKGEYFVTISDENGCTAEGQTLLEDQAITYIENIESSPGDCINEGEITITLTTPGAGPIVAVISGPNSQETISLGEGSTDLSTLIDIPPGSYSIEVYDQNAGLECSQTLNIEVDDNTPVVSALNDNYETESGTTFSSNVLENDTGLNISVNSTYGEIGGTTTIESDGEFQFTPDDDFEGEASFNYIIEDACGTFDTAKVIILVSQVECDFTAQFDIESASCGLEDGSAIASIDPSGNYSYLWSDGSADAQLTNVGVGLYDVTITDNEIGCFLIFEVEIPENEPSYVSNVIVVQPSCSIPAEIQFDLNSSSSGPFLATITHPDGIDAFAIPEGTVFLSDYLTIVTGTYTISLYDSNAGPECTETFSVVIQEPTELTITLLEIIPPSSVTANDGSVVIEVTLTGIPPYDIWLNELVWDQTSDDEFTVGELGVGSYTIFITDAVGCTSNIIEFFVPPPMISPIQIAVGIISQFKTLPESSTYTVVNHPITFVELEAKYQYLGINTITSLRLLNPSKYSQLSLNHLLEIAHYKQGKARFSLKGGINITHNLYEFYDPAIISEISGNINLNRYLNIELFMAMTNAKHLPLNLGMKFKY